MFLNYDVLGLIIDYIDDPATLYSLILTAKWFKKKLETRFQKYFEPVRVRIRYSLELIKPHIYHPIRQSTIKECQRNGGHLTISQSGGYMIVEDLKFSGKESNSY